MVAGIQSGLRVLTKRLCQVEAIVDSQEASCGPRGEARNEESQSQSRASVHILNALVCHALPITDDSDVSLRRLRPFVQRLENSRWSQYYIYYVQKTILSSSNY